MVEMENIEICQEIQKQDQPKTIEEYIIKRVNNLEYIIMMKDTRINTLKDTNKNLLIEIEKLRKDNNEIKQFIKRRFKKEYYVSYTRYTCNDIDDDVYEDEDDFKLLESIIAGDEDDE